MIGEFVYRSRSLLPACLYNFPTHNTEFWLSSWLRALKNVSNCLLNSDWGVFLEGLIVTVCLSVCMGCLIIIGLKNNWIILIVQTSGQLIITLSYTSMIYKTRFARKNPDKLLDIWHLWPQSLVLKFTRTGDPKVYYTGFQMGPLPSILQFSAIFMIHSNKDILIPFYTQFGEFGWLGLDIIRVYVLK